MIATIGEPVIEYDQFGHSIEEIELAAMLEQQLRFRHDFVARLNGTIAEHGGGPGDITSIVIPNHNGLKYLRMCMLSVRLFTNGSYELIVVDNGSSDGSVEWLRGLADVRLIANASNVGYPVACNQGIEEARGDSILLLNNDVVVTPGWLDRLRSALNCDERIGLVGPVTNRVSGEQRIEVAYSDLPSLESFAGRWGARNAGRLQKTDRLVGFCLMVRREVLERIGNLDERFGIGNFEDDDLCRRALATGYEAVISRETFVHHFGSVTFRAFGLPFSNHLLRHNAELYRRKWDERANGMIEKSSDGTNPEHRGTPNTACQGRERERLFPLSLAMIVRNNERTIEAALASVKPWVDEMVVVDTGSTDRTPEICARLGATVYEFPWCDDFARARNESLKYCRGEWVFWMDSDDIIDEENGRKLRELVTGTPAPNLFGFVMQVHCPAGAASDGELTVVDHVKVFRNRSDLLFEGRIHEQILPAIRTAGGEVAWTDLFVVHAGSDQSPQGRQEKLERDFRILERDLAERPDHPFVLFNMGMTLADAGRHEEAIEFLRRSISFSDTQMSHLRKVYAILISSLQTLERFDEAQSACQQGKALFPTDPELRFREAMLHHHFKRLDDAAETYLSVLSTPGARHFTSIDVGVLGFKARHNLARVYEDSGLLDKAEEEWRQIIRDRAAYRPGWRGLADLLGRRGQWEAVSQLGLDLVNQPDVKTGLLSEGHLILARVAAHANEVDDAKGHFAAALAKCPGDVDALRDWARFQFEHGSPEGAVPVLEQVVGSDPKDAAARYNLGLAHLSNGNTLDAAGAFIEAIRLRKRDGPTYVLLARSLRNLGLGELAEGAVREGLAANGEDTGLREEARLLGVE